MKIYGSPTTKFENFKKVLNYLKYINKNDKKGLVIGDSKLDYMISFKNKIPFLYIEQFRMKLDKDYNKKQNFYKLYNFNKIIYE